MCHWFTSFSTKIGNFVTSSNLLYQSHWTRLDHQTEITAAFTYNAVKFRSNVKTEQNFDAVLHIKKINVDLEGNLIVEFRTQTQFRGVLLTNHHAQPNYKAKMYNKNTGMELDVKLVWHQHTFDTPVQIWKAVSDYAQKDYSGEYVIELIPCTVDSLDIWYQGDDISEVNCAPQLPTKFKVPISFQQTLRPVPVVYNLDTEFYICNNVQH